MSTTSPPAIAIIGGGFSGSFTAVQLIRQHRQPLRILLFNCRYPVARGIAYDTYSDEHLLNVKAGNMSAIDGEPDHFVNWFLQQAEGKGLDPGQVPFMFLPRSVYGRYLSDVFEQQLLRLPPSVSVEIVQQEVTDLRREDHHWSIVTEPGRRIKAEAVVLATGNSLPGTPSGLTGISESSRYCGNPWLESCVVTTNEREVLIVGTGLTMVDIVLGLRGKGYTGTIIAISPKGFDILPHRNFPPHKAILDELREPYHIDQLVRVFRQHVFAIRKLGISGEAVVDALRSKTQEIWQQLSSREKRQFIQHLRHLWGMARHRLPFTIHEQIQREIRKGSLIIRAGRILSASEEQTRIKLEIRPRGSDATETLRVDRVINCTGPQPDIRKVASPLLQRLTDRGLIVPHELNLGIEATTDGRIIDSDGNAQTDFLTLGTLLRGALWESTAVPELRVQAAGVARHLVNLLATRTTP